MKIVSSALFSLSRHEVRAMLQRVVFSLLALGLGFLPAAARGDLLFSFQEVGSDVVMTSSGTFETAGLLSSIAWGWGSTGLEENGNHDIMGGTDVGGIDTAFEFNAGTDFSQWASASGPWNSSSFPWTVTSGNRGFATYIFDSGFIQTPGLQILASDMVGTTWTTDQNWIWVGGSFASLGMNTGTYSVRDSITGEKITFQIGVVPEPGTIGLLSAGLGIVLMRRRQRGK